MVEQKLYFTTAERSGDLFAGEVIDTLREHEQSACLRVRAVGGSELASRCEGPEIDTGPLNVLGFWEGIKAYRDVARISTAIAEDIVRYRPDAAILVDSWGLSLRIAQKVRAKAPSIKLIKLIGPQVWASRAGRAKTLAASVDHLLCIHDFEEPYYKPYGLETTVIGHPALARAERLEGSAFRIQYGLADDQDMLLVLPGSRPAEIDRVAPVLIEAAKCVARQKPDLKVCVAPAESILDDFKKVFPDLPKDWLILEDEARRYEAMAESILALSCSGTVNSELAVQRTPFITGYRIGAISWFLMKNFFLKAKFITLLNMAADDMVALELLQDGMTVKALEAGAIGLLDDPVLREEQCKAQDRALQTMGYGGTPAAMLAAEAILSVVRSAAT